MQKLTLHNKKNLLEDWLVGYVDFKCSLEDDCKDGSIFMEELLFESVDRVFHIVEMPAMNWAFVDDFGKDYSLVWNFNLFYDTKIIDFIQTDLIKYGILVKF